MSSVHGKRHQGGAELSGQCSGYPIFKEEPYMSAITGLRSLNSDRDIKLGANLSHH